MSTELVILSGSVLIYLASRYGVISRVLDAVCAARTNRKTDEPGEESTEEETVSS